MGIFDNVIFDEFTLLEGKQADEYKNNKNLKELKKDNKDTDRFMRRVSAGDVYTYKNPSKPKYGKERFNKEISDMERAVDANNMVKNHLKDKKISGIDSSNARDSANRHLRRHGSKN